MSAPLEDRYLPDRSLPADRWVIRLPGSRLGYSCLPPHGVLHVSDGRMVDACHDQASLARLALDDFSDLVVYRWLLCALLGIQGPRGARFHARGKLASITFTLLDMRAGVVLEWVTA